VLEAEFLTLKKPGTGMPAEKLPAMIGRRVARAIAAGEMLQESDLLPAGVTHASRA
jgi:hypothetical protein